MSLSLLTDPAAVHAAIDEYEQLKPDGFRAKYGYGPARNLFVVREGKLFDSKAIAGVAVGIQHPDRGPLRPDEFSGGDATVRKALERLGFTVWSSDAATPFRSADALEQIRAAWGPERAQVKYMAVWDAPAGRALALQLEQESVRVWLEAEPPAGLVHSTHYGPTDTRHSALRANAPSLAEPNIAWLVVVEAPAKLDQLLDWYAELPATDLDLTALEELKNAFRAQMPEFQSFQEPGATYLEHERTYKDELASLFQSEVLVLAQPDLSNEAAARIAAAYYGVLIRKLSSTGKPQNLISWQAVDRLKPTDPERSQAIGRALNALLIGDEPATDRLSRFIAEAGELFRTAGATGPQGIARLLGSCALMLQSPEAFVAIRTDLFEKASLKLKGTKFPTYSDEPGRVRSALSLTEAVFERLQEDGWAPGDLIDVQSFLWVALTYDRPTSETTEVADAFAAFLERFRTVRETPFQTDPELWGIMDRLKSALSALPSVENRPQLQVDWSLGKGVWARVPWIAVMDSRETTSTQSGVYVVFLVARDLTQVHLCLIQGTADLVDEHRQSGALPILRSRSDAYRAVVPELAELGFRLDGEVDLTSEGRRARAYEAGCIAHMPLTTDALPNDQDLDAVMEGLLTAYRAVLDHRREEPEPATETLAPYGVDEAMEGLFLEREEFERILEIWRGKKNMVLQGAPGVGKSFIARRLAYALMGRKDPSRVEVVQFHQSYGYEDFVQGYRPTEDGGFELRDGVFHRFCEAARKRSGVPHVFIIDEINRGNLSKIFGELMLLIEHDKRAAKWAARLAYAGPEADAFHVPENVWILGMMNTADRSLSVVDYALRRRFAFITLKPGFTSQAFGRHLADAGVAPDLISAIVGGMQELNAAIGEDRVNLGPGFVIGHSFFTPGPDQAVDRSWVERVIETEIRPLLEEYWFDAPDRADEWRLRLLSHL